MRIGDYSMASTELARALEERGFESLFVPEHSHIPLTRKSPFPRGGELPKFVASGARGGSDERQDLGPEFLHGREDFVGCRAAESEIDAANTKVA